VSPLSGNSGTLTIMATGGKVMVEAATSPRPPRADARKNRAHILEVAEEVFAADGLSSMDAIAKRAGVGSGTLYRHFPSRESLLIELLRSRDQELEERRLSIEQSSRDPADALSDWLSALGKWVSAFDGLSDPIREALSERTSPLSITCQGFITSTDEFLEAAQQAGVARQDVRGRDLFLGVLAIAWVSKAAMADTASANALTDLLRRGWDQNRASD
jgi:AcrR family transcriptional regulator